eukprot:4149289-Alexandrium_andersonii.AAC.1
MTVARASKESLRLILMWSNGGVSSVEVRRKTGAVGWAVGVWSHCVDLRVLCGKSGDGVFGVCCRRVDVIIRPVLLCAHLLASWTLPLRV